MRFHGFKLLVEADNHIPLALLGQFSLKQRQIDLQLIERSFFIFPLLRCERYHFSLSPLKKFGTSSDPLSSPIKAPT